MSAVSPTARCKRLAKDIEPLASHLKRFRPSCRVISIHSTDWALLRSAGEVARAQGFIIEGEMVRYGEFALKPIERGPLHPDAGP